MANKSIKKSDLIYSEKLLAAAREAKLTESEFEGALEKFTVEVTETLREMADDVAELREKVKKLKLRVKDLEKKS